MGLNEKHDSLNFPATHYVYIEKVGPFQETAPKAWQELFPLKEMIAEQNQITGAFAMYKVEEQIYRAGFSIAAAPAGVLPGAAKYTHFEGGPYIRFVLMGSYMQLPKACGRVFEIVKKEAIETTDSFYLENYCNDPHTTPEDQLRTEILVPTTAAHVSSPTK